MACSLCGAIRQVALNLALTADLVLNAILMGLPGETVSRRTARAREAGSGAAALFCRALTFAFNLVGPARDHCT